MLYSAPKLFLILLTALLTVFTVTVSAQPKKPDEAAALIAQARASWAKDEQQSAVESMKKALALDPNNVAAHTELADMYFAMKYYEEARKTIAEALRLNPNYAPAHQRKAVLLRFEGDYEGSIAEARLALSLKPDEQTTASSYVTLGRALIKLKKHAEAEAEFRKAVSIHELKVKSNPSDALAHAALGDLLFELQSFDQAENSYRRAAELDAKNSGFVFNLANAIDNQGKKDEAIKYFRDYLRLNPQAPNKGAIQTRIQWLESNPPSTVASYLLIDAAERGNIANVRNLISKGANVNFRNSYKTPLYVAANQGHLEVVKLLLSNGAKDENCAALSAAYEEDYSEIEKLLDATTPKPFNPDGIDRLLNAALRKGDAARFEALLQNPSAKRANELLVDAVSGKKEPPIEIIRTLLKNGANINPPTKGTTPLMYTAKNGYLASAEFLLSQGADVNTQTNEGTALIQAVRNTHLEVVKVLLAAGADVKATWATADQVLIMAAELSAKTEEGTEIVRVLLAKGADPNAPGQYGQTPLMHANSSGKVNVLIASGAQIDARDEQRKTALLHAAERGYTDVVSALLDKGADVNAVDQVGNNALLHSLEPENNGRNAKELLKQHMEIARLLLQAKGVNLNAQNLDGETALMRAVRLENVEVIKTLLAKGVDVNRSDLFGDTAVTIAFDKGNREIEELLPKVTLNGQPRNVLDAFLRIAIEKKDEAMVKAVLAEGADPNYEFGIGYAQKNVKRTVLVLAALMGHPGIVQLLLDKGANVNAEGLIYGSEHGLKYGNALQAAEFSQHPDIAALLRKAMKVTPNPD